MKQTFNEYIRTLQLKQKNDFINVDYSDFSNFVCFGSALMRVNESYLYIMNNYPSFSITSTTPIDITSITASYHTIEKLAYFYSNIDDYTQHLFNYIFNGATAYYVSELQFVEIGDDSISGTIYNVPIVYKSNNTLIDSSQLQYFIDLSASASDYDTANSNSILYRFGNYLTTDEDNIDFQKLLYVFGRFFDNERLKILQTSFTYTPDWMVYDDANYEQLLQQKQNLGINYKYNDNGNSALGEFVDQSQVSDGQISSISVDKHIMKKILSNYAWLYKSKGTLESIFTTFKLFGIDTNIVTIEEAITRSYNNV